MVARSTPSLPASPDDEDVGGACLLGPPFPLSAPVDLPERPERPRLPELPELPELPPFLHHDRPAFSNPTFAASSALPPLDASLPAPSIVPPACNLRLPSFDLLGIAAPHPDRPPLHGPAISTASFSALGAGPLSKPADPLHALSPPLHRRHQPGEAEERATTSPSLARTQVEHPVPTVTPPSDPGSFHWGTFVNVATAAAGSPPNSEPAISPNLDQTANAPAPEQSSSVVVPPSADVEGTISMAAWVDSVIDTIITESGSLKLDAVRVLSHALPCPSIKGHLFAKVIAAIHERTTSNTAWINVFHAVPGRFTLQDLPKSPPSTPGPAVGGDEYFTSKVFDSAVAIPDYQLDPRLLPPSPQPVVPPGSVNISIVERYIPPTHTNEFAEMFSLRGRSLLYDRLAELTTDNGVLLLIYPTKTGARTFMQHYLGPVLDPVIRTITVVHDLSSSLSKDLGQMNAIPHLAEYDSLKASIEQFCRLLTGRTTNGNDRATYSVIHSAKEEIVLDRASWADDWWIKQEKPRIRDVVTAYFNKPQKSPLRTSKSDNNTGTELTGAHLIQEIFDGFQREYVNGKAPARGIEMGTFIIKKSPNAGWTDEWRHDGMKN